MTKRGYITWVPTSERLPEEAGFYLITVKSRGKDDPFRLKPWDGVSTEVGFDRFINTRRDTNRGQWWAVRETDVLAWAELPKPYRREEKKK